MIRKLLRSGHPCPASGRVEPVRPHKTAAAILTAGLLVAGLLSGTAAAEPATVQTMISERTNPAVQIITTDYNAQVKLRQVDLSDDGEQLFLRAYSMYQTGQLGIRAFWGYVFDRAQRDPTRYLKETGKTRSVKYRAQYVGSGFVATHQGLVVTARHVVTPDAGVRATFARAGAAEFGNADAEAFIREWEGLDMSTGVMNSIKRTFNRFAAEKVRVDLGAPKVAVRLGVASESGTRVGKNQPAEVVYRSKPDLGADVAVLRIRVEGKLPIVTLADSKPQQGSVVYVNGFPAAATYLKDFSKAAQLQPTLSQGLITAMKSTQGGIEMLQTDAEASGGQPGAAAMNADGQVIGMLVSGAEDEQGSVGQNYLMPVDVIREALVQSGAELEPSETTEVYNRALDDFHAEHYSVAKGEFEQVKALFPAHAYVGRFIAECQEAINAGKDKPLPPVDPPGPGFSPLVVVGSVGGLLILGLSTALVLALIRRRPGSTGPGRSAGWHGDSGPDGGPATSAEWPQPVAAASGSPVAGSAGSAAGAMASGMGATASANPVAVDEAGGSNDLPFLDEADGNDEAPDSFPTWEPIDYVPSVPPTGSNQPT